MEEIVRLHLAQIPHTAATAAFSHCAFTTKVRMAARMWTMVGRHVVFYGVEDADVDATEYTWLMSEREHLELLGLDSYDAEDPAAFVGDRACADTPVYEEFNRRLRSAFEDNLRPGDAICLPFGTAHESAWRGLKLVERGDVAVIETGIGYPQPRALYRVYESQAWRHWCLGAERRNATGWESPRMEWVVPNAYELSEWPVLPPEALTSEDRRTVVYLGRIAPLKGLSLIPRLAAARPDLRFVLCGQGDPTPYLTAPNIIYRPPISGVERASLLGHALCSIAPSRFIEPFCGAIVEAQLVGTPVITTDFGAFTETVLDGVTGFRCRGDFSHWVQALEWVGTLRRDVVATRARGRYSLESVARQYATVFSELERAMVGRSAAVPEATDAGDEADAELARTLLAGVQAARHV
jgi:glycosyltransferase involved in cell wall biosynthesis